MPEPLCERCGKPRSKYATKYCSRHCFHLASRRNSGQSEVELVERLTANGLPQDLIAEQLGISRTMYRKRIESDEALAAAVARGKAREQHELVGLLMNKARKGDTVAAMFLLKCRHGFQDRPERQPQQVGVAVQLTLPRALTTEEYKAILEAEDRALIEGEVVEVDDDG